MTRRHPTTLALVAVLTLLAAACGSGEDTTTDAATKTVEIEMVDIAFEPPTLTVQQGESVRFVFTNTGKVAHDAFIGDTDAQAEHERTMTDEGEGHGGGHGEDSAEAITVKPGDSSELTYRFDEPGPIEIGCHQPGHYASGMKIAFTIT